MNNRDWSITAIIFEAVDILAMLAYCVMQGYYGHVYHIPVQKILINLLVVLLIYAGLTLLGLYPENLNRLPPEVCTGRVRTYSLRLVRVEKCLFLLTLLIPCVCDVAAITLPALYNMAAILVMMAVAIYYEVRIIVCLRRR